MPYDHVTVVAEHGHNKHSAVRTEHQGLQDPGSGTSSASGSSPSFMYNPFPEEVQEILNDGSPMSWRQAIGPWRHMHSSLDLAMSALSLVCLARNHGDERLQGEGVVKYGRVLKDLQRILASDSLALEEETLASCMTLTIFEACHPTRYAQIEANVQRVGDEALGG